MVDLILDAAGQKGTGKWTVISACDLGMPLTLIAEAVFARCLSAQKDERVAAVQGAQGPSRRRPDSTRRRFIDAIEHGPLRQQDHLLRPGLRPDGRDGAASRSWEINNGGVALMWRGGCIIRSAFLGKIKEAFDRNPKLTNLLLDPYFRGEIERCQAGWRRAVAAAIASTASRCRR